MIRIFVVHPSRLICSLIMSVLSEEEDIYPVGYATTADDAVKRIDERTCNMVLVASKLPDNGAMELTRMIADKASAIKVMVIGVPESEDIILEYVIAGASGYVLQDVPVERLLHNVRAVFDDKAIISPELAYSLMARVTELARISSQAELDPSAWEQLTPREVEVLQHIGQGKTNQEISEALFIEVGTVKNHVHNILKKLDVSSREEAANYLPFIEDKEEK